MNNIYKIFVLFFLFNACFQTISSQTISVDATNIIKSFDHNPVSINMDYLVDDDSYFNPTIGIKESLSNMNIGALRYPGGEKSDNYLWSTAPYASANPEFATKGNCNFPNKDARFSSNYINPLSTTMDFDEFMTLSNAIGAKPFIVVAGDAQYNTKCLNPPTLNDLITNAVEWVKYANIKNNFNIKYWMIGNESWNKAAYDLPSTALQYANDFVEFSKAMKAVDPTIKIVANSKPGTWLNTLLANANGYIDAIAISNYPTWDWKGKYDTYRNGNPNLVGDVNSVVSAIGSKNIEVIVSEYNAIDWSDAWPKNNDLGHALVNFQLFGDQMKIKKVVGSYMWNTRWVDIPNEPQQVFDAIDINGNLNANGKALAMWGKNLLKSLVSSTNSGYINSFASTDESGSSLNIFLINKDYSKHSVKVNIANFSAINERDLSLSQTEFSGTSVTDKFPEITEPKSTATISNSSINIELNPLSITIIKLKKNISSGVNDINSQSKLIHVYPNPVSNILNIQCPISTSKPKLKIFNCVGFEVYSSIITNSKTEVDFSRLSSGIYVVQLDNFRSMVMH